LKLMMVKSFPAPKKKSY